MIAGDLPALDRARSTWRPPPKPGRQTSTTWSGRTLTAQVKGLTNLIELRVSFTQVSNAGLTQLQGLQKLKQLWIGKSQVNQAGIAELQRALPRLKLE